jgi:DNA-binding MarR family transcriptional regulator
MSSHIEEDILRSLRRITRAIDLHSKQLMAACGLTGPQLVCLRTIGRETPLSLGQLARAVSLSQATVTGIVDRLVDRGLVRRRRVQSDRRSVSISITDAGSELIASAPSPLQERFSSRLAALSEEDRAALSAALDRVVQMMDGSQIDAAPLLDVGEVGRGDGS